MTDSRLFEGISSATSVFAKYEGVWDAETEIRTVHRGKG